MRPVSKKRAALNRERAKVREELLRRFPRCQAREALLRYHNDVGRRCGLWSTDAHEILTRARGGSITDPSNLMALCRNCHAFITEHPKEAAELGFMKHAWDE